MNETLFVVVPEPKKGDGKTTPDEEARVCPIHRNDNVRGGELLLRVGDDAIEVVNSTNIRRRIRSGDLREATTTEADAAKKKQAASDKEVADAAAKATAPTKPATK